MTVLHILSQRPSHTGSGTTLDAIVRHAAQAGYQQHVIVGTPADDPAPSVGELPADRIHPLVFGAPPLDFALPGMSDVMPYASSRFSALTESQLATYREAWQAHASAAVEQTKPDVIHSHHLWLLSAMLKDIAPTIPVITHCHGTGLRQMQLCSHLADEVIAGCRRNDHFAALHQQQAEDIAVALDVSTDRISVVGAGYREETFHAQGREVITGRTLAYAGKLSRSKGLPQLLDAVELLRRDHEDMRLHIAGSGSGEEAEEIKRRIDELHPHVVWHGQMPPGELANLLRRCCVFVLPSFYEGLPLVVVEAIACGCRVVATELPGAVEVAQRLETAIDLVRPPTMQSIDEPLTSELPEFTHRLAAAIEISLAQPPLADSAERTRSFTWKAVFERVDRLWRGQFKDC